MIACVDVDYRSDHAIAACVTFDDWTAAIPTGVTTVRIDSVEPYVSGQFYKRELPCLLTVLDAIADRLTFVIVDGYVWLGDNKAGLGAHLYDALDKRIPVIGVAKTAFRDAPSIEVRRGKAARPLQITAVGIDLADAARHIASMHGDYRLPSLLKLVDRACRDAE
ncbi:MAG: endonuclease V [Capsulimonas sp.]|uniref:endonuclease V n=1 Tax=Capsulimonas sp. TaxID=2494211 RepID=UPI00326726A8